MYGGWVEGLYLSVTLIGNDIKNNPDLAQMIYEQKISLDVLISLLELFKDKSDIQKYLTEINELKVIYENISSPMTQDNFEQISSKVKLIRNSFTKTSF